MDDIKGICIGGPLHGRERKARSKQMTVAYDPQIAVRAEDGLPLEGTYKTGTYIALRFVDGTNKVHQIWSWQGDAE